MNFLCIFAKNGQSNLVFVLVLLLEPKCPYPHSIAWDGCDSKTKGAGYERLTHDPLLLHMLSRKQNGAVLFK